MLPPLSDSPRVSVILPARNAAAGLEAAVTSILNQTYGSITEIAIAVGPSNDNTGALAEDLATRDPRIQVVPNPAGNIPDGLNVAIDATTAEVIVRVDSFSVLPAGYVADAVETLQTTGAVNVGAIQHSVGKTPFSRSLAAAVSSRFGVGNAHYRYADGDAMEVDTAYLGVFRRDAIDAVGGYDESFLRNEDYELNVRLRKNGGEVWLDPRLVVDYRPRQSFAALALQYWNYGWGRLQTIAKHPDSVRLRQLVAPALVIGIMASLLALVSGRRRIAAVVPAVYAVAVAIASAVTPGELSPADRARLLAIYPTLHVAWGSGLLASASQQVYRRIAGSNSGES